MKPLSETSHYDILDVSRDASVEELGRAYRLAQSAFGDDALATYSLYGSTEAAVMRERIELAWRVLGDTESRARYDASLGEPLPATALEIDFELDNDVEPRRKAELIPEITGFDDLEEGGEGPYDGARLRRARLRHGVDIGRIAAITKISPVYLRSIEDERFDALPASVYVRGFVTAYARCVGLDPARVVPGYMERLQASRPVLPRSRRGRG
jgi:flagellar biosynthesis protein FlhG